MKRVLVVFVALLMLSSAAFADDAAAGAKSLSVHTFTFKYKDADKAAAMIKSLLSAEGSMSIQPSTNALVVTDRADNLKTITKALTEFDVAPQAFRLTVRLVGASRVEGTAPKVADELRDLAPKLAMLRFNALEALGSADVAGREGDPGIVTLPTGYRADFKFGEYDPASDSLKVSDFHLSKLQNDQLTSLLKTTLNLRIGQTYIVGATKAPQSQRALMIVLVARK
ncbi:MAG TPA: secretin N-terminal domain-containing protein [Thermoanaerobaculia bacterium]|nr:secretin N-terminal domain-containing protein [Thermoanaerobaculia bacterium]